MIRRRRLEIGCALVAFVVYAVFSGPMLLHQSKAPHFVLQAAGFLNGTLSIPGEPPNLNDWVLHDGRWFSSFPAFPAVLMLPFVAIHGPGFNDVFFTVCLAALNAGLMAAFLRALRDDGQHERSDSQIAALTALFAFGTVHFYSSIRGEVWFTAHVIGVGLLLVYLMASLRGRSPLVAGLALGCAATTRASLIYAAPFFVLEAMSVDGRWPALREVPTRLRERIQTLIVFAAPVMLILALHFAMNEARFGAWSEFGHALLHNNRVNDRVREWGLFHPHYLADNLRAALLLLPKVQWSPFTLGFDGHGMSLLVTTPILAWCLWPAVQERSSRALAVTAFCVAMPGLLYMNDGWYQFGYRFSNDFLPMLFGLIAIGRRPFGTAFRAAGAIGVAVCTWGAVVFGR